MSKQFKDYHISDQTRRTLALWIVAGFVIGAGLLVLAVLVGALDSQTFSDVIRTWATVFGTVLGFVFGYYFRAASEETSGGNRDN